MYNYASFEDGIKQNGWEDMQFVSVSDGEVIGYMSASINRMCHYVNSLALINFSNENIVFSKDMAHFFKDLFEKFMFNKINWKVCVGNPAEKLYDKVIKDPGGRVVGIFKNDVKLWDNQMYDVKHYEILKEEFKY
jgi:hypothetical protein